MMTRRIFIGGAAALPCILKTAGLYAEPQVRRPFEVTHSDEEWRKLLTPDQYAILRQSGTERPYTSAFLNEHRRGDFACAGCDLDLFSSAALSGEVSDCLLNEIRRDGIRLQESFASIVKRPGDGWKPMHFRMHG